LPSIEEELRPLRRVNAIVKVASAGVLRFFHACATAAKIGDPSRPDFLMPIGARISDCWNSSDGAIVSMNSERYSGRSSRASKKVYRYRTQRVVLVIFLNDASLRSAIKLHLF